MNNFQNLLINPCTVCLGSPINGTGNTLIATNGSIETHASITTDVNLNLQTNAGPIHIYGGVISLNANLISSALNAEILVKGSRVIHSPGVLVQTNGGSISYDVTNASWSANSFDQGIRIGDLSSSTSIINAQGGNISLTASFATSGVTNSGTFADVAIRTINTEIKTSGIGSISIDGNGYDNASTTGDYIWGLLMHNTTIQTADGALSIKGTGGKNIINSRGIIADNTQLSILSNSGAITITDVMPNGHTGSNHTGLYLRPSAANAIKIGADGTNVVSSTSNIVFDVERISLDNIPTLVTTSGTVTIKPIADAFATAVTNQNLTISSSCSGFTVGKPTNTTNVTITSPQTIAGPITVYGNNIEINENLNTSGAAAGHVLLKATNNITQAVGKTITTNGGDVTFWADSDNNKIGGIRIGSDFAGNFTTAINTNGGNITLSGGSDLQTGFAHYESTLGAAHSEYNYAVGVFGATLDAKGVSSGGNILVRGNGGNSFNGLLWTTNIGGQYGSNTKLLTNGSGTITVVGDGSEAPANPIPNNSRNSWGVILPAIVETASGNISVVGKSNVARTNARGFTVSGTIQSLSGAISLEDVTNNTVSASYTGPFINGVKIGKGTLDASSSNVYIAADKMFWNSNVEIHTTGDVLIESNGNAFVGAYTFGNVDVLGGAASLTIGKSTNNQHVTIAKAQTIAGPITVYGNNLALNAALTATNSDINLHATGNVTQTAALNANGLGLNGTATFNLNNTSNNVQTLSGGNATTKLASLNFTDATGGLTIGTVGSNSGIAALGTVLVETLNGNITLASDVTNTTVNTIIVNAGKNAAIGSATGGNIIVSGTPTVSTGANGIAKLFSGSNSNGTGLTDLVGGSSNVRFEVDETTTTFNPALQGGNVYALFRELNVAPPTASNQSVCSGAAVSALVATGNQLQWYTTQQGGTALAPNTPVVAGTYYVSQTISGNESERTAVTVTVTPNVTPTFNAVGPFCTGSTIGSLTTTSLNGFTGTWSPAINNTTTTTYTFTPTAGQCATSTTLTIVVETLPVANAGSALNAVVQGGTTAAMGGSVTGATGGIWSGGSGTWTNATNPATATYTAGASEFGSVTLTLTSTGGACNAATATKTIQVNLIQGSAPSNSVMPHVSPSQFNGSVNVNANVNLTWMPNTAEYRIKITGSNIGGWNNNVIVFDRPTNNFTFQQHVAGFIYGTQYTVEVAHKINGSSVFSNYGTPSFITVNVPSLRLTTTWCNANINFNTLVNSTVAFGASEYRFRITGQNGGGNGWNNNVLILDRPSNNFSFQQHVPGFFYGVPYTIEVAFKQNGSSTFSNFGSTCTLTVNAPTSQLGTELCNGSVNAISNVNTSWIFSAIEYRFKITGPNGGGNGWNNNVYILDRPSNDFSFVQHVPGFVYGAQYNVEVAYRQTGTSTFGSYGSSCGLTVNIPTSQLTTTFCGNNAVNFNANVTATSVWFAAEYRFKITGSNNGAQGWNNNVLIVNRPTNSFNFLQHAPGSLFGTQYSVEVAYRQAGSLEFGSYGPLCNLTLAQPITQIQSSQCGISGVQPETTVFANAVAGAAGYRFKFVGSNITNWDNNTFILDRPIRTFWFDLVSGSLPGEAYEVSVAVMDANGNYGPYGSVCTITRFGVPALPIQENNVSLNDKTLEVLSFSSTASHNPFTIDFGIQVLNANDSELINVAIYDLSGKLIERIVVHPMDIEQTKFGENLSSGMYMIEVRQGSNHSVIRQLKN